MGRRKGNVYFSGSLEVMASAPIDARRLVEKKSDLINPDVWKHGKEDTDTNKYLYNGLDVIVFNDTIENNGIYILNNKDSYYLEASWTKQTSSTNITIPGVNPTGNYDETTDKVYDSGDTVSIGGVLYICTVDGTTNIKPTVTAGWESNWALFQLKGGTGAVGESPYINQTTKKWEIKKPDGSIHPFEVVAEGKDGLTPRIENGYWYVGNTKLGKATGTTITIEMVDNKYYWFKDGSTTGVLAEGVAGKSAIANIALKGLWDKDKNYYNIDPKTGKTDVVVGSDGIMYYALVNMPKKESKDPVTDTAHNKWVVFAMYGEPGKTGDTPYVKDGLWYVKGEVLHDNTTGEGIRAAGSIVSISTDGYWEIDETKTDRKASITIINETIVERDTYTYPTYEVTIAGINPRGLFVQGQTYDNVNVAEDGKTDMVVGSDEKGYICKVDGTTIDPVTDTTYTNWALFSIAGNTGKTPYLQVNQVDGKVHWFINGNDQSVVAEGVDGNPGANGVNGLEWYINAKGCWCYRRYPNTGNKEVDAIPTDNETKIKAEVDQPNIREGMWFVGDTPTGVQALGESTIANLNYCDNWEATVKYWHKNASVNNWTDVVLGADDVWYYAKTDTIPVGTNPCKQVNGVWVYDETKKQYWVVFASKGSRGADGKAAELRWFEGVLQWRPQGSGNDAWVNLITTKDLALPILSDIASPVGGIIMWSGLATNIPDGYLLCNGDTVQKTEYPILVEALKGSNTANSAELPDLRGRFVVGYADENIDSDIFYSSADYDRIGKKGGLAKVGLTIYQMPKHDHKESISNNDGSGLTAIHNSNLIGTSNQYRSGKLTESTGNNEAHENRPPYYVIAYIIKASYSPDLRTPYDTYKLTVPDGQTPMTAPVWLESMRGETGATGINPVGYFNIATTYHDKDTVVINNPLNPLDGNSYVCSVTTPEGQPEVTITGIEPGITAGWQTNWYPLVMRGAPGKKADTVLINYSTDSSTAEGSDWHATPSLNDVYARFSTDGGLNYGSPIRYKGDKGNDADPIQIRYSVDGTTWTSDASTLSKYIQFKASSTAPWSSTISISGGSSVFTSNTQINLPNTKSFGKYAYNALIPSKDKTFEEVLRDIVTTSIPPSVSISAGITGAIPYNDSGLVDRNITVSMNASINNSGANWTGTTAKRQLWYRRVENPVAAWKELKNQPGNSDITANQTTYTHNVKDLLASENVKGFEYKFKATDSTGATAETAESTAVTPALYAAPSCTIPSVTGSREMGDINIPLSGQITLAAQNGVSVLSYGIQCSVEENVWNVLKSDSYSTAPTMPISISYTHNEAYTYRNATSISYMIIIITTSASGNQTKDINLGTVSFKYNWYATTADITTMTAQTLVAASSVVTSSMVMESGANKQSIEFPPSWGTITKLEQFNTLSNAWDVIALSTFTPTSVDKTIQGVVRSYKKYTHNGALIGARQLRWTV